MPGSFSGKGGTRARVVHPLGGGGVLGQLRKRANRPAHELPSAVGAYEAENARGAVAAKRAFKRAHECCRRIGGKVPVAAFAVGSDFEGHVVWWLALQ